MVRSKGSSRAFSSVDHVTTSSTFSCLSFIFLSRFSARGTLFFPYVSILFYTLSFSLLFSCSLASPLLSSVDTIESVYRRCYEYKYFVRKKKNWEHGLPPDPNSSTSPRYFRSPVLVRLLPTKSLPRFFQL